MKATLRILVLALLVAGLLGTSSSAQASGTPTRISFARGTTGTTVQGWVGANQVADYVIRAGGGQYMSVALFASQNDIAPSGLYLVITDRYGNALLPLEWYQTSWTGTLPRSQDYLIRVFSVGGSDNFRLKVSIPAQIRFAPGTTGTSLLGFASPYQPVNYFFDARAYQYITLTVYSPNDNVRLTLSGADGQPLVRSAVMGSNTWSGTLPATQRYYLSVEQMNGSAGTNFRLFMTIVG
ncbi:MAG: hypothetical protein U0528_01970 [Anaerolineae bacterium]|nr:hypothetical protein [Anaerolineae bacterium]